ncbi:MAG TPA: gamma-glutamyltransferase, partial [Candidatus Dormibacteraeota bacterium]|nr:gamma-glutamyltransferase [Candidatus Dormibacteraeota bacterium]
VAFDFGSGVVCEGTGMLLQNRGAYFSLDPDHVNRLEPKKRTMHTLIPGMASRDGKPWLAFGGMGGDLQPQIQAQVLVNLVDHGLAPDVAVARPRMAILGDGVTTAIEADHPQARELNRSGAAVQLMPARHPMFGHAHAIVVDGPKKWRAGADPRSDGSAVFVD